MSKGYIAFKCLGCGYISLFSESKADGHRCMQCGGHITPIGKAGFDFSDKQDMTIVLHIRAPRSEKERSKLYNAMNEAFNECKVMIEEE